MFYFYIIGYFILELIAPLTFGTKLYGPYYFIAGFIHHILFCLAILSCIYKGSKRKVSAVTLLIIYSIGMKVADLFFGNISAGYYMFETMIIFLWMMSIFLRIDISTAATINKDNILLAFYKGPKGSFIMRFFELFGMPVKSMCIMAGDKALYLKSNKKTFEFGDSSKIYRKSDEYVIVDTGLPYDDKFISKMKKHQNIIATRGIFRIRCIEGVRDLLDGLGDEYKPKSYIPSIYLRGILNAK